MCTEDNRNDNDELVYCEGADCGKWFHQNCHDPPIRPIPKGKWHCSSCTQTLIRSGERSDSDDDEAPNPKPTYKRRKARPAKVPRQGERSSKRLCGAANAAPGYQNESRLLPDRIAEKPGRRVDRVAFTAPVHTSQKAAQQSTNQHSVIEEIMDPSSDEDEVIKFSACFESPTPPGWVGGITPPRLHDSLSRVSTKH